MGWGRGKGGEREIERKRDTVGRMRERVGESGRESQIKTQLMETNGSRGSSSVAECLLLLVHKALGWILGGPERVTERGRWEVHSSYVDK